MSDPWLIFTSSVSPLILSGVLVIFSVLFMLLEWKRNTSLLPYRIIAVLLMMISLAGIFLRPEWRTQKSNRIVLLTPGYDRAKVDSLLKLQPSLTLISSPGAKKYKNALTLRSYHELYDQQNDITFIIGQGLPPEARDLFDANGWRFIPSGYPSGIIRLNVQGHILPKRKNLIEGVLNNTSGSVTLSLEGPGGTEDSVRITGKGFRPFRLTFTPKEPGNFLYTLAIGNDQKEKISITVQRPQLLNVIFIQHYPTFETRELKKLLGGHHRLLYRYQPSRNKYRYEFINRTPQTIGRLTEGVLSAFDLLVIDTDAFENLSAYEKRSISAAVKEGLGVITLFNARPSNRKPDSLLPFRFKNIASDTAHIILPNTKKVILPAWAAMPQSSKPLIATVKNKTRILSGYYNEGFGKMGFQLLQETYSLALAGDSISYSNLWSPLLEQTARTKKEAFEIRLNETFPLFPNTPFTVELISVSEKVPSLYFNNSSIPLAEDIIIDDLWKGKLWTDSAGWHSVSIEGDSSSMDFYISEKGSWQSLVITDNIDQTRALSNAQEKPETMNAVFKPVPLWIFFVLFLLSAGFSWLTPKL